MKPTPHPLRVVLIDDSPTIRKIVEVALHRAGYEVDTYADPVEALQTLAQEQRPPPALLLIDLGLPGMDGLEVIGVCRAHPRLASLPIVVVTARGGVLQRLKARWAGAQGYITKPFKEVELLAVVRQYQSTSPA